MLVITLGLLIFSCIFFIQGRNEQTPTCADHLRGTVYTGGCHLHTVRQKVMPLATLCRWCLYTWAGLQGYFEEKLFYLDNYCHYWKYNDYLSKWIRLTHHHFYTIYLRGFDLRKKSLFYPYQMLQLKNFTSASVNVIIAGRS